VTDPQLTGLPEHDPTAPLASPNPDPATENNTAMVDGEPVPTMLVPDDEAQRQQREQLVTARPGNLDDREVLHFLRVTPDGAQLCGGDGKPWPCDGHQQLMAEVQHQTGSQLAVPEVLTRDQAALLLGISRGELDDRLHNVE
jgi:hypothetical protein